MHRTRKLLMGLTASALLTGSAGANPNLWEGRAAARNPETLGQDPSQTRAEQAIKNILKGITESNPMSVDEIVAADSSLTTDLAKSTLKKLVRDGAVGVIGAREATPRYYDRTRPSSSHSD